MSNNQIILQLCAEFPAVSFLRSSPCPLGNGQQHASGLCGRAGFPTVAAFTAGPASRDVPGGGGRLENLLHGHAETSCRKLEGVRGRALDRRAETDPS